MVVSVPVANPPQRYSVDFFPGPKDRHYEIDGERIIDGQEIQSVTTVLKEIGDKFGVAAWWGMKTGVAGTLQLIQSASPPGIEKMGSDEVVSALTKHKLTVNHVRDSAGDRGTSVHKAAEDWARHGDIPDPHDYPDTERGYIKAFLAFLREEGVKPVKCEVRVGSKEYAYAGTYDLEGYTDSGFALLDYKTKTSKPKGTPKAYEQNHLQLAAYETARREMGMVPTTEQYVVNLYPDGTYALIENKATEDQWLRALDAYRALAELKDSLRVRPKKVAA